jgi:hypothetical protein
MQREYQKRTTLRSESSTSKGLLYTPDPDNCKKGMLSDQPRLLHVSSTVLLCCWGCSRSKIWCPSWLTLRRMPHGRGTLRIPLQSICSEEGPHYHLEQSARNLSYDKQQSILITSLEIPWGFHTQAVLRSLVRPRSCKKVSVWGFLRERKVWFVFSPMDVRIRNLRQKAEKGKFTGSEATTRFPRVSCFEKPTRSVPETLGCMYDVLAWSANGMRNGTRNWIPVQPRKARRN